MTSIKPYLVRAVYQWAVDEGFTPHVLVDVGVAGAQLPSQHIKDGKIVLNVHPEAVNHFELGDDWLLFSARFSGKEFQVEVPIKAITAIFAKENGQGMSFPAEDDHDPSEASTEDKAKKVPTLKVVK